MHFMFGIIPGLYPLEASNALEVLTTKMSPDIAKYPLIEKPLE